MVEETIDPRAYHHNDSLGRPRARDGSLLPQKRIDKLSRKWGDYLDAAYAGNDIDENQVIYRQVKERKPEEIENITQVWLRFLRRLGKTKAEAQALLPQIDAYKYSLTQCIVNGVVPLTLDDVIRKVLQFKPFVWQDSTMRLFEEQRDKDFAIRVGRQGGKTFLCATYGLANTIINQYPYRVGVIAQSKDAATEMFIPVSHYVETNELLWWCVKRMTRSEIEFDTGSTIQIKPSGYRGGYFKILFIDEAAHHDDEKIEAVEPAIMAVHGRIIAISTPNGKRGWFYNKCTEQGDKTIKLHYPSSVNPNITPEQLDYKRKTKAEFWFCQEYLADWIDWSGNAFTPDEITQIFKDEHNWHNIGTDGNTYYAGMDFGSSGADESILIIGHIANDKIVLDHYSEWSMDCYRDQIMGKHDEQGNVTRPGVIHLLDNFKVKGLAADTMGAGEGAIGIFPPQYTSIIEPVPQSIQWHAAAYQSVKYYTERAAIYAPRQDPGHMKMEKQLIDLVMKTTEYGRRPIHPPNEHDDTYSALALLIHTYMSPNTSEPMMVFKGKSRY